MSSCLPLGGLRVRRYETRNLLAALLALVVSDLTAAVFLGLVRRLHDPSIPLAAIMRPAAFSLITTVSVGLLSLVAIAAIYANTTSAAFLIIIGFLCAAGIRAYAALQEQHLALGRLYAFQETLGALTPRGPSLLPVLENARSLLRAESVSVFLPTESPNYGQELRVHLDEPAVERLYRTPADYDESSKSNQMAVDLRIGERRLGTLVARDRLGTTQEFGRSDLKLLRTMAAHVSDALERGTLLEQLQLAATRDVLTGLLMLGEFLRQLEERVVQGGQYRLCLLDVAGLHEVNDSLGHDAGDALLGQVAARLIKVAGEDALIARSGGGEFAMAILGDHTRASRQIEKISKASNSLVQVLGVTVELRSRIGWLTIPRDAIDSATAIRRADLALAFAKKTGAQIARFTGSMEVDGKRRLRLVNDLRTAMTGEQLRLVYQPLVTPVDGRVVGAEALVRWDHPQLGELSPDEFIPLAEQTGLILDLTKYVLGQALEQLGVWEREGRNLHVAVNISARCLGDMTLPQTVIDMLGRHRMDPCRLTLEVTETSVAEDPIRALAVLEQLRDIGVRLSIDDFGTGYSSLAALKRFPVHEVKLDRQFLVDFESGNSLGDTNLLSAIVSLGHSLELDIVAEGVESVGTYKTLRSLGIDVLQGYYLGRPGPAERLPFLAPINAIRRVARPAPRPR